MPSRQPLPPASPTQAPLRRQRLHPAPDPRESGPAVNGLSSPIELLRLEATKAPRHHQGRFGRETTRRAGTSPIAGIPHVSPTAARSRPSGSHPEAPRALLEPARLDRRAASRRVPVSMVRSDQRAVPGARARERRLAGSGSRPPPDPVLSIVRLGQTTDGWAWYERMAQTPATVSFGRR